MGGTNCSKDKKCDKYFLIFWKCIRRRKKIGRTYFKIQGTYFKIGQTYFLQGFKC